MSIDDIIAEFPEALRPPVALWYEQVGEHFSALDEMSWRRLLRAVACSEFFARQVQREPQAFLAMLPSLDAVPNVASALEQRLPPDSPGVSVDQAQQLLRQLRNQHMLAVYWRDLHGLASLNETLQQLSALADHCLQAAYQVACQDLADRFGLLRDECGAEIPLITLGMGKLGGRELNFSSDIDLIFCYPTEGQTDGRKTLSAQEYCGRLSQRIITLLDAKTADGFVFRVDTRLRPFGASGPPVVSFASLESYLLSHGRDWERYAYVKARIVGAQPAASIGTELMQGLLGPFVYRRYLDYGVFESLREMHAMVAAEVQRRDLQDNVKLGPGGIREIEFIVQALQLLRGGSDVALQHPSLLQVMPRLVREGGLSQQAVGELSEAYEFLRRLENFIQAMQDQQTHELPVDNVDRQRLCVAMGFAEWSLLLAELQKHRANVVRQFEAIAFRGGDAEPDDDAELKKLWAGAAGVEAWERAFSDLPGDTANLLATQIATFAQSRVVRAADSDSAARLAKLMPQLIAAVQVLRRPELALQRCLAVVDRVVRRSAYIALLNESAEALQRFVELCERSRYISDQLAQHPVLLDELLDPRAYSDSVSRKALADELQQRIGDVTDSEQRIQIISRFQRAVMFRVAVADFAGTLPIMKVSDALTWLAEVVVEAALGVALADLADRHGLPEAGFAVIAYGKLGGLELSYGSDLDVVFLHNAIADTTTDGDKPLDTLVFFSRLVRRLVHLLTTQTGSGQLYEIDTRLRPDGRSGLLVTGTDAFEKYQVENAWTWEHQALLRARPIVGDAAVCREFARIREETLTRRVSIDSLAEDVVSMRRRMRAELDRSDTVRFDLKHGAGGIGDLEFLVQYLVLRGAAGNPGLLQYSDNIRQLDALVADATLEPACGARLQEVYRRYRAQQHHLALDDQPPLVDEPAFAEERSYVTNCWARWLG